MQRKPTHQPAFVPLEQAFEQTYPAVFRYFRYCGVDADTANDLAAATFERALRFLRSYDPKKSALNTWLFTIARNVAADHWKAQRRGAALPLEAADSAPTGDPLPESALIARDDQRQLLAALRALDERERDLLALKFAGRMTNRQIAALTGLTEANVGVIVYRSLQKMRVQLAALESEVQHA